MRPLIGVAVDGVHLVASFAYPVDARIATSVCRLLNCYQSGAIWEPPFALKTANKGP